MPRIHGFGVIALVALLLAGVAVDPAGAATVLVPPSPDELNPPSFNGNDCSGRFGQGFANCSIPANIDPDQSPIIIKFNFDDGVPGAVEINSGLFPSIDGSEFALNFDGGGSTGTWTYTPGAGDPGITFWVAKGGAFFNLFTDDSGAAVTTGTWVTPLTFVNGNPTDLSHIDFYDTTGVPTVPEPGSLVLVGVGLLGGAWLARRKKS